MIRQKMLSINYFMMNQPIINIGTTGHVANGKSTMVKCLSGKETQQFSNEKERNITIRLGYANTKIWKCDVCIGQQCYSAYESSIMKKQCQYCNSKCSLVNHISIVDCPGHKSLTATMLNGSCVMDYDILVESCSNKSIPAPQTAEHLLATYTNNIPTFIIAMNKVDIVKRDIAYEKIKDISSYITDNFNNMTIPPIVPVSATFGANIDV
jgi:translation initiation factor 2 subunit 3